MGLVGQVDVGGAVVAAAGVVVGLDAVGVVAGAFDYAGVGPVTSGFDQVAGVGEGGQ